MEKDCMDHHAQVLWLEIQKIDGFLREIGFWRTTFLEYCQHKAKPYEFSISFELCCKLSKVLKVFRQENAIILTRNRFWMTVSERITSVTIWASTNWSVIHNKAMCICTTRPWTRITALFIDACLITWTFGIYYTFRFAVWRSSDVRWETRAWWRSIEITTLRIRSTRWWVAWIAIGVFLNNWC